VHGAETPESLAWAELQRRGTVRPRYLRGLEQEISAELARCFDPFVHEQDIRPYGAIVARETPHLDRLGRVVDTEAMSVDVIRSLADGQHSVVLVVKDRPARLLLLHERMDTDQDYASHAVWVDGLIICNDAGGVVRIVTDSSVTLVQGRRWIAKDLVYEAAEDIVQVVPVATGEGRAPAAGAVASPHEREPDRRHAAVCIDRRSRADQAPRRGDKRRAAEYFRVPGGRGAVVAPSGPVSRRRAAGGPQRPVARRQRNPAADAR